MSPRFVILASVLAGALGVCAKSAEQTLDAPVRIWAHQGQEAESRTLRLMAEAFNRKYQSQGWRVELTFFPDFQFTEKIAIAAAARDLPDGFEIDGPLLARYVDAHLLAPIDDVITESDRQDFLPTIVRQGTIDGRLYALGIFDSAAVLYYDKEMLAATKVALPSPNAGWTWNEFLAACSKLKASGVDPLAMHMDESANEWFTYAFSPVVWSGGGELISPDGRRVRDVLASETNIRCLTAWQKIFVERYAATDPVDLERVPGTHDG